MRLRLTASIAYQRFLRFLECIAPFLASIIVLEGCLNVVHFFYDDPRAWSLEILEYVVAKGSSIGAILFVLHWARSLQEARWIILPVMLSVFVLIAANIQEVGIKRLDEEREREMKAGVCTTLPNAFSFSPPNTRLGPTCPIDDVLKTFGAPQERDGQFAQ